MKLFAIFFLALFSSHLQAASACKCYCNPENRTICASGYDLDHPCRINCLGPTGPGPQMGKTACPTKFVFNPDKGIMEWRVLCAEHDL